MPEASEYDVAIVGGGPGGSTTGALLRTHSDARVLVVERERFPRDHVGESQLPPIGAILHEMGCWDAVEGAGFPIKVGATFRWGREAGLWDFDFLPEGALQPQARPAPYAGQRTRTAFQVERSTYDEILLRRAEQLGCEVRQQTGVTRVHHEGDRITSLELSDGQHVRARWYVDASGGAGVIRRAMGVDVECPTSLKNVAVWDYWEDARWAERIGIEGTRIQVLSLDYGWLWFISITGTRASVGLVVPTHHLKQSGRSLEQLYHEALEQEPRVRALLADATARGRLERTKDWSFVAERSHGDNWFLVGEAVGFADPILSAGMTLTQMGARELAYTLAALLGGEHDPQWLRQHYDDNQRTRIWQHIRFADFWYVANGQFVDLREHSRAIARDAGLQLGADEAWRWLALGGFSHDVPGQAMLGGYDLAGVKQVAQRFLGQKATWQASAVNMVRLRPEGVQGLEIPYYRQGKVIPVRALEREGRRLPLVGTVGLVAQLIPKHPHTPALLSALQHTMAERLGPGAAAQAGYHGMQALELLLSEGWAEGWVEDGRPFVVIETPDEGKGVHAHRDAPT